MGQNDMVVKDVDLRQAVFAITKLIEDNARPGTDQYRWEYIGVEGNLDHATRHLVEVIFGHPGFKRDHLMSLATRALMALELFERQKERP